MMRRLVGLWHRIKHAVVHNVLHLDDTPHRIALGVFLGFFVGFSPTLGFQMIIYFALAFVLKANTASGLLPIWFTNPFTAVPVYYSNWRVGSFLLTGRLDTSEASRLAIAALVETDEVPFFERLASSEFWHSVWSLLGSIGGELWVGSLFVGVFLGLIGYFATLRCVRVYRTQH